MLIPILGWMLFGLIVGAIARALYPGPQPIGLIGTMLLGIAGSFLGGFIASLVTGGSLVNASGWIGSILGALALIAIVFSGRRRLTHRSTSGN